MKHFQWYRADVVYDEEKMIIGRSCYNGYPFTALKSKNGLAIIEGVIYNKSDSEIKQELDEMSQTESSLIHLLDKVKKFLLSAHGEFIIVKYDKEMEKCLIFNDALGRLPFYYCSPANQSSQKIALSREVKFLIPFLEKPCLDRWSIAEYLLFGFPLGEKTLWRDVKRLPPATMLLIDTRKNEFLLRTVLLWNMDPKDEQSQTESRVHEKAKNLVNVFVNSLKDIEQKFSEDFVHVVSLSGGLDSRATLAGLLETGVDPTVCSFPSGENRIAKRVARALKVRYQILSSSFKISDTEYVKLTNGLLDLGLQHVVEYLYTLRESVGNKAILYTGDGGDRTVGPIGFGSNISNEEKLIQHIIRTDHLFTLEEIYSMLSIEEKTLREHLENHIAGYPEKTLEGKFIHFKVFDRAFKWLYTGEDRNRLFLWSVTPFYYVPFFEASMELSQRLKEHYLLYRNFLSGLNTKLPRIQYYNKLIPLSIPDPLLKSYLSFYDWLKRHFHEPGTTGRAGVLPFNLFSSKRTHRRADEIKSLVQQALNQRNVFDFFELPQVRDIVEKETNQKKLSTLASLIIYCTLYRSTELSKCLSNS